VLSLYEKAAADSGNGAELLGFHLEGPCFSEDEKGAQDPRYLVMPEDLPYRDILSWSKYIKRWDLAPELPGGMEMGGFLASRGVRVSIAHSSASYADCVTAFENGFTMMTHFYACLTSLHKMGKAKGAGAIEAGYALRDMYVEVIADGAHMRPDAVKAVYQIKGPERVIFITDAMRAAASDLTESVLGSKGKGQPVYIDPEFGVARLKDSGVWAGSAATMQRLVRVANVQGGVPIVDTVRMASTTPAEAMGVQDRKGSIGLHKDADLVIFDDTIAIRRVILKGNVTNGIAA
jgi:N-acetylglucosamine-6-phosphate deacetylase